MLRIGIVGAGWFGTIHRHAWMQVAGVEIAGVCDPCLMEENRGNLLQAEFHNDAGEGEAPPIPKELAFERLEHLLAQREVDLVDIVTTEDTHAELVILALEARKDVIVEKPLALGLPEANRILDAVARTKRNLYVGHILRFDPRYVGCMELLHHSRAEICHMSFCRHFQHAAHDVYGRASPYFTALIHDIDLAIWAMNRPPDKVLATERHFLGRKHPDAVVGLLSWENGPIAVLQNSWHLASGNPYGFSFESQMHTTNSTYMVKNASSTEIWNNSGVSSPEQFLWPVVAGDRQGALVHELRHFAASARKGARSTRVPYRDVLAAIAVASALQSSAVTGQYENVAPIVLPPGI